MSPEERQKELDKLPPDRRAKLEKQLQRFDQLSPAEREQLLWFSRLPQDRQNAFRKAYQKYQNAPADRQQAMREELTRLQPLPPADRANRLASPDIKSRFTKSEQQIVADMVAGLPPTESASRSAPQEEK